MIPAGVCVWGGGKDEAWVSPGVTDAVCDELNTFATHTYTRVNKDNDISILK